MTKRNVSEKILKKKAYEIALNLKYNGYQRGLESIVYIFDKKVGSETEASVRITQTSNKNSKKIEVYASFKGNIGESDLAQMESLSSINKNVKYILCVIDVLPNMHELPLKDKKPKTVAHGFIEIVNESKCKPNKLWVDQRM